MAKILITEDEDALRIFVARALKLDGHETVEALAAAQLRVHLRVVKHVVAVLAACRRGEDG